jgi:hypothetical protein
MKTGEFVPLAEELFGATLAPFGFTCAGSRYAIFHRQIARDVFHVIQPDQGTRGVWFDIRVFPTSPQFQVDFQECFPDRLGGTNDAWGHLNSRTGVGLEQEQFNCKSEEIMRRRFERTIANLLVIHAIPYLDQFTTVKSMLSILRGPFVRFRDG